jgi:hypothetical protein
VTFGESCRCLLANVLVGIKHPAQECLTDVGRISVSQQPQTEDCLVPYMWINISGQTNESWNCDRILGETPECERHGKPDVPIRMVPVPDDDRDRSDVLKVTQSC